MFGASYAWRHGDYYNYGWFVPPAAAFLTFQRWKQTPVRTRLLTSRFTLLLGTLMLPFVLILRVLGHTDPLWSLPVALLGVLALLGSHTVIAKARGWRNSSTYILISLLWISALPWPSVVETWIVQGFTDAVLGSVTEILRMFGWPVELLGDRIVLHDVSVEVTDGCSGVRSFQSFVMATWFFAELQRLRPDRVLILLAFACLTAFMVNVVRTIMLAVVRFDRGEQAFRQAHDHLGLAAFALSAVAFYWFSNRLAQDSRRIVRILHHKTDMG